MQVSVCSNTYTYHMVTKQLSHGKTGRPKVNRFPHQWNTTAYEIKSLNTSKYRRASFPY